MRTQRAFAPPVEITTQRARTDFFWCRGFNYAVTLGACHVRQGLARYDGSIGPACGKKATDGHTVCGQGRLVLVALGIAQVDQALAEPVARADLSPRFEGADLPDITPPPPPAAPPARPPDDYHLKLQFQPRAREEVPVTKPDAPKFSRQDPAWRDQQGDRMKAVRAGKLEKLVPLRDAWLAGGKQGPPPAGICDQPACESLLRSDSTGTTCSHCRMKPPAQPPAHLPPPVDVPAPVVLPRPPVRSRKAEEAPPAPPSALYEPSQRLPPVTELSDEYLAACVGEHSRRTALAALRR